MQYFCLFLAFARTNFALQTAVFIGGDAKIVCTPEQVPLLRQWPRYEYPYYIIIALLRHQQIKLIEGRGKSLKHRTGLIEIV